MVLVLKRTAGSGGLRDGGKAGEERRGKLKAGEKIPETVQRNPGPDCGHGPIGIHQDKAAGLGDFQRAGKPGLRIAKGRQSETTLPDKLSDLIRRIGKDKGPDRLFLGRLHRGGEVGGKFQAAGTVVTKKNQHGGFSSLQGAQNSRLSIHPFQYSSSHILADVPVGGLQISRGGGMAARLLGLSFRLCVRGSREPVGQSGTKNQNQGDEPRGLHINGRAWPSREGPRRRLSSRSVAGPGRRSIADLLGRYSNRPAAQRGRPWPRGSR